MTLSPLSAVQSLTQAVLPRAAVTTPAKTTPTSSSGETSAANIGTTFLSLLVQELQNQDPTAPMDSTAMVGQMISLNQLSQLTSINQTLSTSLDPTTATTGTGTTAATGTGTTTSTTGHSSTAVNAATSTQSAVQSALRLLKDNIHAAALPSVSLPAF